MIVKKKKIDSMQQNKQKKKNPQVANGTCSVDKSHLGNWVHNHNLYAVVDWEFLFFLT